MKRQGLSGPIAKYAVGEAVNVRLMRRKDHLFQQGKQE